MKIKYFATLTAASILTLGIVTGCATNSDTNKTNSSPTTDGAETQVNPCAGKEKENPCAGKENPCAAKENPCASKN
jgi:hypothetical protein